MSLWKRVTDLIRARDPHPPVVQKTWFTLRPGDVVQVELTEYIVEAAAAFNAIQSMHYVLRDGRTYRHLVIDRGEGLVFRLYETLDGRLDDIGEIPETVHLDGVDYHLESQQESPAWVDGPMHLVHGDTVYIWNHQSDDRGLFRVEWQNGKYWFGLGRFTEEFDARIIAGT
ncbi:DUF4178 domain-containing protein [Kyrpidia sp.]|uniref:DUF4178 domain-containing protein n=1 Tax=Kyrpidia sp. TaxID=2073077 RepID=UPI0017CEB181|nr:DUF4178 domain-containing protein [Kyrpidia sp.]MCL6574869.1 DUF4178 domain-containing protein [Kyrpidia sp.]HHY66728.1 DUF4178 domain-containing protein [Alicyclobacillus sp.]